jgi:hypothetical protein
VRDGSVRRGERPYEPWVQPQRDGRVAASADGAGAVGVEGDAAARARGRAVSDGGGDGVGDTPFGAEELATLVQARHVQLSQHDSEVAREQVCWVGAGAVDRVSGWVDVGGPGRYRSSREAIEKRVRA